MLLIQAQENGVVLDKEGLLFLTGEQTNNFDADVDDHPIRDLALNDDNNFQADECDAFDSDADDKPTTQSIFMANLSLVGPTNQQVDPSNASILSEVHDLENAIDPCDDNQDEHEILNEELVAIYEQRARFELTLREQKMDKQMNILIRDRNQKEENLKKELHSVKLQLNLTIQNNKIIEENVTASKQEFKQKETKFLTDFSNLKNLKYKLENKLYSQDQSIQTVYMMLKPTELYEQDAETDIGVQNPFYLKQDERAQSKLYDGNELIKPHHVPVLVTSFEEDLELAETTRIKMSKKMNDHVCVEKRVRITPSNYSKENFMATFTPQTQLTPKQVFWSKEVNDKKSEDLKARIPPLPVLPPTTVFENLKAEVDQNAIDLKSGEIEQKNLLIANENLIANYIAHDVFFTVTDSAMTASRFHELSAAYYYYDDHDTMTTSILNEIENLKTQLKGKMICVTSNDTTPKVPARAKYEIDVQPIPPRQRDNRIIHHGVSNATKASMSQPESNTTHDRTSPANSVPKKNVKDHHRKNKSKLSKKNRVDSSTSVRHTVLDTNSNSL
uniref:Retrovirus-related Pol polyprotein from transposon TNT 1-94 n=1 Tax=Tanacetum cinerariifolium TaxID=118510 RepID=A0A699H772_TANCI|nr:hypothetical protein [Tanacetum cinerariifolium]